MADPNGETPGQRLPPLITRVPPPEPPPVRWWLLGIAAALLVPGVSLLIVGFRSSALWMPLAGMLFVGVATGIGLVVRSEVETGRGAAAARAQQLAQSPDSAADPLAAALASRWRPPRTLPDTQPVLAAVRESPEPEPPRPRIVCLGVVEVPAGGDFRFEPVIITPTRLLGRRLWLVVVALLVTTLWIGRFVHVLPLPRGVSFVPLTYFLVAGTAVALAWIWRTIIRPTYIRLAPGVVQILRFPFGRGKPQIRSYPMSPGTVVIVRQPLGKQKPTSITLARGDRQDELPILRMSRRTELMERFWQALLSTAPTPPLSDEDLLG